MSRKFGRRIGFQGLPTSRFALREARITSRSRAAAPPGEKRRTRRRTRDEDREARSANNFAPSWEPLGFSPFRASQVQQVRQGRRALAMPGLPRPSTCGTCMVLSPFLAPPGPAGVTVAWRYHHSKLSMSGAPGFQHFKSPRSRKCSRGMRFSPFQVSQVQEVRQGHTIFTIPPALWA